MKTLIGMAAGMALAIGGPAHAGGGAQPGTAEAAGTLRARVGTYDSRALAIAYVGTDTFRAWMAGLQAEHEKAKAAGNTNRVAELEAEAAARQRQLHMQGFSTAPVDDVLRTLTNRLAAIRRQAGVVALVSVWDTNSLAAYRGAELVDVTTNLVDALGPDDRQRKFALQVSGHKPIPLEQAARLRD